MENGSRTSSETELIAPATTTFTNEEPAWHTFAYEETYTDRISGK
jgi:hypothetical protein